VFVFRGYLSWFKATGDAADVGKLYSVCSTSALSKRKFVMVLKWISKTIRWDTANWCVRNSCEKRYSLFWFHLSTASAYTHACISLSSTLWGPEDGATCS